ncbi:hypothetical protein A2U01_0097125, partial [Trifolium medium]|nr:hypothetical protein [Trifolium medium]
PEDIDVAEPQPGTHAPAAAEEEDGEEAVGGGKKCEKLEGPSWTECVFRSVDPAEFPRGPKDTSVLTSYGGHFARY